MLHLTSNPIKSPQSPAHTQGIPSALSSKSHPLGPKRLGQACSQQGFLLPFWPRAQEEHPSPSPVWGPVPGEASCSFPRMQSSQAWASRLGLGLGLGLELESSLGCWQQITLADCEEPASPWSSQTLPPPAPSLGTPRQTQWVDSSTRTRPKSAGPILKPPLGIWGPTRVTPLAPRSSAKQTGAGSKATANLGLVHQKEWGLTSPVEPKLQHRGLPRGVGCRAALIGPQLFSKGPCATGQIEELQLKGLKEGTPRTLSGTLPSLHLSKQP